MTDQITTIERYPRPGYLLGALVDDGVDEALAVSIAKTYDKARESLADHQTHQWLMAMLGRLGGVASVGQTALACMAYESEHDRDRYLAHAEACGWKES